ncbi:hypothetical protein GY659_23495, partial [Escherichia coli]|nr:hypothetical protein [Escherichia coli]
VSRQGAPIALGIGGEAGDVTVSHDGALVTTGERSIGIHAQSIGGGGGNASFDFGLVPGAKNQFALSLGQSGGTGGTGGAVSVNAEGAIDTSGGYSSAIFAQSVGGGGGKGGDSGGLVTIGGNGSAASTGGTVTITNTGSVDTL